MAAHRIIRVTNSNHVLPRCKSEGTLIDLNEGLSEASLTDVKVPSSSALRLDNSESLVTAREVVAIKDYCPSSFTTLKFSKGDRLYVMDTSGGEWWYAHNNTEMGYIPSAYVQPINCRNSSLSDSGMIDNLGECTDEVAKELDLLGEWTGVSVKTTPYSPYFNSNPFSLHTSSTNPFINSAHLRGSLDQNCNERGRSTDLLVFDSLESPVSPSVPNSTSSTTMINGFSNCNIFDMMTSTSPNQDQQVLQTLRRDNPFFRSKRSYSLSELSVLQTQSNPPLPSSGFFTGLKAPSPEQFQSREDFRTAWLNHRKLARSCHDLDSLGQSPGWGQTQPVETNIVCKLDSRGGAVQLPDTQISVHVPEGHVGPEDTQQISMKALLDPPLELNNDHCSTVSPVVEIKLSNMETKSFITLEMTVSVTVKKDSGQVAEVLCVRSDCKEGPYIIIPHAYLYKDTVQVQLDNLEPCMYVVVVVQAQHVNLNTTVWDNVLKKVTLGVYGPKHIHPSFKTVVALFGHDCAPNTLLVSEVGKQAHSTPPVALTLWGKHQFFLGRPQDLQVGLYSNMSTYMIKANEQARIIRGSQVKLGKVSRLIYMITSNNPEDISDFTLQVQVKDGLDCILAQFCVQTPQPPPKSGARNTGHRRFLKKKEVVELDNEPEKVASVLEKLKEDCTNVDIKERKTFQKELMTALLKMDCQGLVARLIMDFVLLTTAVEVAPRWRELAEKLARVNKQQMEQYEAPHRDKNGLVDNESMWKPAYDFLLTWAAQIGDSYRDVIQELHLGLDRMKNPITKRWKHLTGTLILVNSLDTLRSSAFSPVGQGDYAI
ncbi:SH3 domain-binding protein 4-A-like isoform X2 [Salvelinus namaycush]|uniref:SH3 domain-binding protein 4-A-like isoform X2 n=1 Tax=Salvelinus namaycush TaxID=8040 RepID=A0A8U0U053_SALNM|nr:SH3 domain-binding protein 4-A-like isoform X2 [Salvelinus namaycush]